MRKGLVLVGILGALALASPAPALAGSSTDAALGLGAFAVFNQILSGTGIFGVARPAPVVVSPPPVVVQEPPAVVYTPPPPVVYAPPPAVYAPAPPVVYAPPPAVIYAPPAPVVAYPRPYYGYRGRYWHAWHRD